MTIPDAHKAVAVSVLTDWFDQIGEVSRELGDLLVMLNEGGDLTRLLSPTRNGRDGRRPTPLAIELDDAVTSAWLDGDE